MSAIVKKDNVYVLIESETKMNFEDNSVSVILDSLDSEVQIAYLYGGRVEISKDTLYIDGISIFAGDFSYSNLTQSIDYAQIAAYLNQIENLGIDTFLKNYKESIENFKQKLSAQADQLEQDLLTPADRSETEKSNMRYKLKVIKDIIYKLTFLLLNLAINMNAGLDNEVYEAAYQYVINLC